MGRGILPAATTAKEPHIKIAIIETGDVWCASLA